MTLKLAKDRKRPYLKKNKCQQFYNKNFQEKKLQNILNQ